MATDGGAVTTTDSGWGAGDGWGTVATTNNGWDWNGGQGYRRQRHAPRVWVLRSWSRHMGRTARPPTSYQPRRRPRRTRPPTFDAFMRSFTVLLARLGRRILARGLVQ